MATGEMCDDIDEGATEAAQAAGEAWAEREAGALMAHPDGAWRSTPGDALPLVDDEDYEDDDADRKADRRRRVAELINRAAADRWAELVGAADDDD